MKTAQTSMKIALLHTNNSNIDVYNRAADQLKIPRDILHHKVHRDLLNAAESGVASSIFLEATRRILIDMAAYADGVLLNCSTIGPAADNLLSDCPILRADRALAEETATHKGKVVVLYTVPTTLEPTQALFEETCADKDIQLEFKLVPQAWELFKANLIPESLMIVADAGNRAIKAGAKTIVLAQASMADAASMIKGAYVLTSPKAGLQAMMKLLD